MNGILNFYKEEGITSFFAVKRVRRIFGEQKAGHTGTLDPLATGVLPILLGNAVKASEYMLDSKKCYRGGILFGMETDTADITGKVIKEYSGKPPAFEELSEVLEGFRGRIMQVPPMYSALKVDGKKLYEIARRGETVQREPREIEIYSLTLEKGRDEKRFFINVECSKGTYIRTLIEDIGRAVGVGAVMESLERTKAAGLTREKSYRLEELERMNEGELERALIPVESLFSDYQKVNLPAFYERLAKNGAEIYTKKIGMQELGVGEKIRVCDASGGFFALGEVREFDGGNAIKPIKLFL